MVSCPTGWIRYEATGTCFKRIKYMFCPFRFLVLSIGLDTTRRGHALNIKLVFFPFLFLLLSIINWIRYEATGTCLKYQIGVFSISVPCPTGWIRYEATGTCFKLVLEEKTWSEARTFCKEYLQGDLIKIWDGKMNAFVYGKKRSCLSSRYLPRGYNRMSAS